MSATTVPLANPRLDQSDAIRLIQAERAYQDRKWGSIAEHPHEVGAWLLVLKGKYDAAVSAWQSTAGSDVPALVQVIKVAAVALACLEQHGGLLLLEWIRSMEFSKTHHGYMDPSLRSQCYWPVLEEIQRRMKSANTPMPTGEEINAMIRDLEKL